MTAKEFLEVKVKSYDFGDAFGLNKLPIVLYPEIAKMMEEYVLILPVWELELTEKFFYESGRFTTEYVEISYWYNPITLERKETVRKQTVTKGDTLSDWAKECGYRPHLNQC